MLREVEKSNEGVALKWILGSKIAALTGDSFLEYRKFDYEYQFNQRRKILKIIFRFLKEPYMHSESGDIPLSLSFIYA